MENSRTQRWLIASFFSAIAMLFIYFIISIALDNTDEAYHTRLESARVGPGSYHQGDNVHLIKDQPVDVERIRMIYRGRVSGALRIDLVLLDLDADYVYSRSIPLKEARKGFRISDRRFVATSINGRRLRLVMQ